MNAVAHKLDQKVLDGALELLRGEGIGHDTLMDYATRDAVMGFIGVATGSVSEE